jgi:hypothetical protein
MRVYRFPDDSPAQANCQVVHRSYICVVVNSTGHCAASARSPCQGKSWKVSGNMPMVSALTLHPAGGAVPVPLADVPSSAPVNWVPVLSTARNARCQSPAPGAPRYSQFEIEAVPDGRAELLPPPAHRWLLASRRNP